MWWPVVFWILLIPLIIVEFILFLKTRKFSWLIYALAIFTYVIAITYVIDVFDLGKNAVILVLLASSGLMVLLGRRLRMDAPKEIGAKRIAAISIGVLLLLIFIISAIFGRLQENVQPVASIDRDQIVHEFDAKREPQIRQVTILNRTLTNNFIMPIPVPQDEYKICLATTGMTQDLYANREYWQSYPEVGAGKTLTIPVTVSAITLAEEDEARELLVYKFEGSQENSYAPCAMFSDKEPVYRIPVE